MSALDAQVYLDRLLLTSTRDEAIRALYMASYLEEVRRPGREPEDKDWDHLRQAAKDWEETRQCSGGA